MNLPSINVFTFCLLMMGATAAAAEVLAPVARPIPVTTITASTTHSYAGGTPLHYGINVVEATAIADTVSLPPATGSGQVIDVHTYAEFLILVWPAPGEQINQYGQNIAYAMYPRQRLRFIDVKPGHWDFTTNLPMYYPIYMNIHASAGGGQTDGTYLGMGTNVISGASGAGDSLRMPLAVGGTSPILIYNKTPVSLKLFPDFGQKLNWQASNTPYTLPSGKLAIFQDIGPGPDQWVGGVVNAGYPLQFESKGPLIFNPSASTDYFIGQGLQASVFKGIQRIRVPRGGRISSISVSFLNLEPGSNESSSLYVQRNQSEDTLLSSTLKNDGYYSEIVATDVNVEVATGDYIEIKWSTPDWDEAPGFVTINGVIYIE